MAAPLEVRADDVCWAVEYMLLHSAILDDREKLADTLQQIVDEFRKYYPKKDAKEAGR